MLKCGLIRRDGYVTTIARLDCGYLGKYSAVRLG